MPESLGTILHAVLAVLGLVAIPESGLVSVTVALVALTLLALMLRILADSRPLDASSPHPLRAVDRSATIHQSDPDAAGHPRPRAPGGAALAA